MKTIVSSISIALCLALGVSAPALADRGYHRDGHRGHYVPPQTHHRGHHHDYRWAGPAALLAITGIAAGIAASSHFAPEPVYAPPRPVQIFPAPALLSYPATNYWNYCASGGQYYPYVNDCPEGWQLVPAR